MAGNSMVGASFSSVPVPAAPPPEIDVELTHDEPATPSLALPSMTPTFNLSPTVAHEGAGFVAYDEAEAARQVAAAARMTRSADSIAEEEAAESAGGAEAGAARTGNQAAGAEAAERNGEADAQAGAARVDAAAVGDRADGTGQLHVDVTVASSVPEGDGGGDAVAASPTIDTVSVNRKLADLKAMKKSKGHAHGMPAQSADWNAGVSMVQIPEELKMLDSVALDKLDQETKDRQVLGSVKTVLGVQTKSGAAVSVSVSSGDESGTRKSSKQKSMEGLKLRMKRMNSFNRGSQLKNAKKRNGGSEGEKGKEEEEIEGPHRAPRIAHSLLHGKPTHVPAMYAAEGLDLMSRSSLAELSTQGSDELKKDDDLLREELVRMCEEVLDTQPLSRTIQKLRQVCTLAKANGFSIGGSDVPDYIAMECWRYVTLERIPSSFTLMKQGDDAGFMCFVLDGLIDIFVNDVQVNTCGFGTAVGELALMQDPVGKRSATLVARGPCLVARLDWTHYHRILKTEHEAAADNRNRLLAQFPIFREWSTPSLLRVSRFLEYKEYKRGDAVVLQGLKNSKLFIVATGLVGIVVHISPETEVEQKVADQWLKKTRDSRAMDATRSAPIQKMARKIARKTTVEVARLGPGHHFSNVKRTSEDPRKLTVRWDRKTRAKNRMADMGGLGELAAVIQPGDHAPFTVVCHTDCVLYRMDLAKMQELQSNDIALLRNFYETAPEIPDGSYIRDLIHQQIHWNEYKGDLINEIVESRARRSVHGDMIAGESLVSRRARGGSLSSSNISASTVLRSASTLSEFIDSVTTDPSPVGPTRGPARNISQPPTKTSLLREFHASQQRLSSTSLPELNRTSMAEHRGQGYLPGEEEETAFVRETAQLGRSATSYRRWMKTKAKAAKRGASLRVPTPELKSGNGVKRERVIHKTGTDSGLKNIQPGTLAGAVSATDHLTALVLAHKDKVAAAERGGGIYGDTLWEKHEDLVPTGEHMDALEKLKGWNVMRKAALKEIDEAPRFLKENASTSELLELFAGHEPPKYRPQDAPPPSEASLQADPWVQHDLQMIPGVQQGERKGMAIEWNVNRSRAGASAAAAMADRKLPRVK
jgi:CRP-like cAMP-binding protein